jgi:hypothetical protein
MLQQNRSTAQCEMSHAAPLLRARMVSLQYPEQRHTGAGG